MAEDNITQYRSIKVEAKFERLVKTYSGQEAEEDKIWNTQNSLMMFAANLGIRLNKKKKLGKKTYEITPRNVVNKNSDITDHIDLIAVADTKSVDILGAEPEKERDNIEERFMIYESYLNGGMHALANLVNKPGKAYDLIIAELQKKEILVFPETNESSEPLSDEGNIFE